MMTRLYNTVAKALLIIGTLALLAGFVQYVLIIMR